MATSGDRRDVLMATYLGLEGMYLWPHLEIEGMYL